MTTTMEAPRRRAVPRSGRGRSVARGAVCSVAAFAIFIALVLPFLTGR